jgi:hypothetical protein
VLVEVYDFVSSDDFVNNFNTVALPLAGAVNGIGAALDNIALGVHATAHVSVLRMSDLRAAKELGWLRARTLERGTAAHRPGPLEQAVTRAETTLRSQ